MLLDKIKQLILKGKIILFVIIIIISIFYLKAFFTKGVYFNDIFLKKHSLNDEIHYINKNHNIKVIVKGKGDLALKSSAEVRLIISNDINKLYKVNFNRGEEWSIGEVEIIDENGKILFDGNSRYGMNGMLLFDKKGDPVIGNLLVNKDAAIYGKYRISLKRIVEFACHENETIRGEPGFLVIAVFLLLITIIDIKYPLLFFTLSHFLSVKDPEPSDYYIFMQKISWIVCPLISLILLIVAI